MRIAGRPGNRGDTNVWALAPDGGILGHARWVGDDRVLRCAAGEGAACCGTWPPRARSAWWWW